MDDRRRGAAAAALALAYATAVALRIALGLADPGFDRERPERMLKSDPALHYYVVERIVESGGLPPPDFRADPRVEHPARTDLPALLPIQQEFFVAWIHLLAGGDTPLHVVCTIAMAFVAGLTVAGVFGLAREITGSLALAAFAAWLHALSPGAYRTLGFVLMNEDWSVPWLAIHLWLLARAARVRRAPAFAAAAAALGLALASWHAMSFFAALGAGCAFAWFLRTGENPLRVGGALALPAVLAAFGLAVPVLRHTLFLLSLPMLAVVALAAAAAFEARVSPSRAGRAAVALGVLAAGAGAGLVLARLGSGGFAEYSHVFELAVAKLRFLGRLPENPLRLSFEARLLWQGPFETASVRELFSGGMVGAVLTCVAACAAAPGWWRGRGDGGFHALVAFAVAAALAGWGIRRNLVLPALLGPVVAAAWLARTGAAPRAAWMAGLLLAQALLFAGVMSGRQSVWYFPVQQEELASAVRFVRAELGDDGAVASDFVTSGAILAGTRHPIVLQPKYESRETRRRIRELLDAVFHGSPDDLRAFLDRYDARYLLVDRELLWSLRYVAGLPWDLPGPAPGSAAAALLSRDPAVFGSIAGLRLRYRSPHASDLMRLYEREPAAR